MYIIYTPPWFFTLGSIFELLSAFITIFIGYYSYKIYKLIQDKKYFYFSLAFGLFALSFIAKAMIILCIAFQVVQFDYLADTIHEIKTITIIGFVIYTIILLTAYMILLIINLKITDKKLISLLMLFVLFSVIMNSNEYHIFFMVSAILLAYITHSYYSNYIRCKSASALFVFIAFLLIFLSQFFFIFTYLGYTEPLFSIGSYAINLFLVGHIIQLGGYLTLLGNLFSVLKK